MNRLKGFLVWLSRIGHCRGFGIQSPTDYWLVRYVINEHWPYYQYDKLGLTDDWLARKVGRLCFRLANWRQPSKAISADYRDYITAGCKQCRLTDDTETVEMAVVSDEQQLQCLLPKCSERSLLVLDKLYKHRTLWNNIVKGSQATVVFDLYYCGIMLFDRKRTKKHYTINF